MLVKTSSFVQIQLLGEKDFNLSLFLSSPDYLQGLTGDELVDLKLDVLYV